MGLKGSMNCVHNTQKALPGIVTGSEQANDHLLTRVLRFALLSPATDTDTEREKLFPGDALLGLLDMESWEPDRLRSRASPVTAAGLDAGLRAACIL